MPVSASRGSRLDPFALERRAACAYSLHMGGTPHRKPPADWDPPMPSEAELLASLALSEAEFAAGLTVDGAALIRELYESAEQLEAKQQSRKAARRR
jgi:hypothetical protein